MRGAKIVKTARARRLRRNSTDAELRLWHRLRSRALGGCKFVRQEPIGPYVVDFVCRERRVVIEVDGGQHSAQRDTARDRWLIGHRYRVMHFWNTEVIANIDGVLQAIAAVLKTDTPPHPILAESEDRPLPASGER